MAESIHDKLKRVRKPRVHITYEVETGGAMVVKELPFVVGVMGDYAGNAPTQAKKRLEDRKFIGIDRDNFNDVMARIGPGATYRVENTLTGKGELPVELKFESMDDFEPEHLINQIEPLRKLLDARNRIRDLLSTVDKAEDLDSTLERIFQDGEQMKKLAAELGLPTSDASPSDGADR